MALRTATIRVGSGMVYPITVLGRIARLLGYLAILAYLLSIGLVIAGVGPALLGYNSFLVLSSSMAPAVLPGSIVVSAPTRVEALDMGDVITFRRPEHANTSITHRIVAINYKDGHRVFLTKGDANKEADAEPVLLQGEVDRMVYAVPLAGYIAGFARSREGIILFLILPAMGLLTLEALSRRRRQTTGTVATVSQGASSVDELQAVRQEVRHLREALEEVYGLLGKQADGSASVKEGERRGQSLSHRTVGDQKNQRPGQRTLK